MSDEPIAEEETEESRRARAQATRDVMADVLRERGLVQVFAMEAGSYSDEGFKMLPIAWYDAETRIFFSKSGTPSGASPEESARSVMPAAEIHPGLCASPFEIEAPPARHLTDLVKVGHGEFHVSYRHWDPAELDDAAASKCPEFIAQYSSPWCAIVAQEFPRYQHRHGLAIRWALDVPSIFTRNYLFDTHNKVVVEPDLEVEGDVTYLGAAAPKTFLRTEFRGKGGLADLRLFYAGLPR